MTSRPLRQLGLAGASCLALTLLVGFAGHGLVSEAGAAQDSEGDRPPPADRRFAGSVGCRECHERFYRLWATSYHGLAMQPFTAELAQAQLLSQKDEIKIGRRHYVAEFKDGKGWVRERGADGEKKYPIAHVMGGKNVYPNVA